MLTTLFSFSLLGFFIKIPLYEDYCNTTYSYYTPYSTPQNCSNFTGPSEEEIKNCLDMNGVIAYFYKNDCVSGYQCQTCSYEYDLALKNYRRYNFIITSIIGIILILAALNTKLSRKMKSWVYSSVMISGISILLISTVDYFSELDRLLKPLILLMELFLIISIARKEITKD